MDSLVQIQNLIYEIRGVKVMLDSDLASMYEVPTKRLNEAVKRNITRFPSNFMFRLTKDEWFTLRSQFATFKKDIRKYPPYVFTEQYFIEHCNDYKNDMCEIYEAIDLLMDRTKPAKIGFVKTED